MSNKKGPQMSEEVDLPLIADEYRRRPRRDFIDIEVPAHEKATLGVWPTVLWIVIAFNTVFSIAGVVSMWNRGEYSFSVHGLVMLVFCLSYGFVACIHTFILRYKDNVRRNN